MPLTPQDIQRMNEITGLDKKPGGIESGYGSRKAQEIRDIAKRSLETRSSQSAGSLFTAKTDDSPIEAGLKAAGNLPSSAFNLAKNVVESVRHPIQTGKGIVKATAGLGEKAGRLLIEKTPVGNLPTASGETARERLEQNGKSENEQTFDAVANALKERYGSIEAAQRTATNDPVAFGADVLAVLSGGAGLVRNIPKIGAEAANVASKVAAPVDALVEAGKTKLAGAIEKSAEKSISKVLAPTKQDMKVTTQRIGPELTSRRKIAFSRKGLEEKYATELEAAGQAIDEELARLPEDAKVNIQPIIDELEGSKERFIIRNDADSAPAIVNPIAWEAADNLQKVILSVSKDGNTAPMASIRKLRQIWDKEVRASKGFTKDLKEGSRIDLTKEASDAIRKELAKEYPSLDAVNKEYSLWKNAESVIKETNNRITGREASLTAKGAGGLGAAGGFVSGGIKEAAIVAGIATALTVAIRSTAWRTLSAAAKSRLAQAIVEGNEVNVRKILAPILVDQGLGIINETEE